MDRASVEAFSFVFGLFLFVFLCIAVSHWNGHAVVLDDAKDPMPVEGM